MRMPIWIRPKYNQTVFHGMKALLREHGLSTVCEEARCPNRAECFAKPTAAFMILGDRCTRNCGFCSVNDGIPASPDPDEPRRIAEVSRIMGLSYVVITSVTRDDLSDGGARQFAGVIRAIRESSPSAKIEALTPDFQGDEDALKCVIDAGPDVFNHNVETVPSLYHYVRPQADFPRSLNVLRRASMLNPRIKTKSGLMLGLGESREEVIEVLKALRDSGVSMLTIGQYLRPTRKNLPVVEYINPEVFDRLHADARGMGFEFVASAPMVRSSMNAEELYAGKSAIGRPSGR